MADAKVGTVGMENVFTLFGATLVELVDATGAALGCDKDLSA